MRDAVTRLLVETRLAVIDLPRAELDVQDKGPVGAAPDLVTRADLLADGRIREGLAGLFPSVPVVSEEQPWDGAPPSDAFVLDPVDGTHNFAAGVPIWAIPLARVEAGRVVEAWLLEADGTQWYAARGAGCWRDGERARVTEAPLDRAILSVGLSEAVLPLLLHSHLFAGVRMFGSHALALAWAANGRVAVHAGRGWPWDVAAGLLLVEEAGGRCCGFDARPRDPWQRGHGLYGAPHAVDRCLDLLAGRT